MEPKKEQNNKIFAIKKPKFKSSNQVIQEIKKRTNIKKIGHGGTLDPIATGVLIIGINEGTKLLGNNLNESKEYVATIEFGFSTTTYDIEGEIVNRDDRLPKLEEIESFCKNLLENEYLQEVPLFSAVKVNGKELYKYARSNENVEKLPKKNVKLFQYKIIDFKERILIIKLLVSKGFYIRSFVNDLASYTNTLATMIDLNRTRSGDYDIKDALTVDEFVDKYKNNLL